MWQALKKYNWEKLISDLIVVMLSAGLTFLINWFNQMNMGNESSAVAGGIGLAINKIKPIFRNLV